MMMINDFHVYGVYSNLFPLDLEMECYFQFNACKKVSLYVSLNEFYVLSIPSKMLFSLPKIVY